MKDQNSNHIHLLITGGTIDSIFNPNSDAILVNATSVIKNHLEELIRPHFKITQRVVTLKDSREITDHTRQDLVEAVQATQAKSILITHGTYTMAMTAKYLKDRQSEFSDKVVVLTGSFWPLHGFSPTDASFNLGFACASALLLQPGVYLAMNGRIFLPEQVKKNLEMARFEPA